MEARVKFAEAWLKDKNSSVNKLISATEEAIEAMEAKYDEQELSYKEQGEALDKDLLAINEKLQAAVEALNELRATSGPIIDLKEAVWQAIKDYRDTGFDEWSQDLIDREVTKLKTLIEQLEVSIEDQNHAIETAQRNLDGYNNGNLTALQTAKEALEALLPVLSDEALDFANRDAVFDACKAKAEELGKKNGWLLYPLGIALSGKQRTPGGGTDLACMMGRETTLERVKAAIEKLNG